MKALLILIVLGAIAYMAIPSCGDGRVAGPLSPPLHTTYRTSNVFIGIVMVVQNQSNEVLYDLKAKVHHYRGGGFTEVAITDSLKPADTKEMGSGNLTVAKG